MYKMPTMHLKKCTKPNPKLLASIMAPILLFTILSLLSLSFATHNHVTLPIRDSISPEIQRACKATRFPDVCETYLSNQVPPNPDPTQIILSTIKISSQNLNTAQSLVRIILDSSASNINSSNAANNCLKYLNNSEYRLNQTAEALPRGRTKDARAWTSAALLFQYDCWSALKYVNDTQTVNQTMSFLNTLTELTSNALSMIVSYDVFGNNTASWKAPETERGGFWEPGRGENGSSFQVVSLKGLEADVTVCAGQLCNFTTVQEAVDVAPEGLGSGRRFVIGIKEGVYKETIRVGINKTNLVFLGDGMGKTVITGSLNAGQPGISTYNSATVGVLGDGFMASGLTIENTAGPDPHQAVALRSDSDLSVFENCEIIGNQDTLFAHSLRQFFKSCRISGNVDFIFGNSASVFQDCIILVRPRQINPEKGENNAITAHGRTDPAQSTGFVFQNCIVNGTNEYMALYYKNQKVHKNYLGRPWKDYSRTVFIECNFEALITPQGWMPWSGDVALKTLYYGEYGNMGPGSNVSGRVVWSSQIPPEHVGTYSVQNFIQGDEWISTSS